MLGAIEPRPRRWGPVPRGWSLHRKTPQSRPRSRATDRLVPYLGACPHATDPVVHFARRIREHLGFERSTLEKERLDRFIDEAPAAAWAQVFEDAWARGVSIDLAEAYADVTTSPVRL